MERTQVHNFQEVLMLVIYAIIVGCDQWPAIETYGKPKMGSLKGFLQLKNGISSHDKLGIFLLRSICKPLPRMLFDWILDVCQLCPEEVISIDDK